MADGRRGEMQRVGSRLEAAEPGHGFEHRDRPQRQPGSRHLTSAAPVCWNDEISSPRRQILCSGKRPHLRPIMSWTDEPPLEGYLIGPGEPVGRWGYQD